MINHWFVLLLADAWNENSGISEYNPETVRRTGFFKERNQAMVSLKLLYIFSSFELLLKIYRKPYFVNYGVPLVITGVVRKDCLFQLLN